MIYRLSALLRWVAVTVTVLVLLAPPVYAQEPIGGNLKLKERNIGGDFTLTDHNGERFRLSDHRGKVVLLFFGYTTCTEACPVTLAKINGVYKRLGEQKKDVLTVFVSVDPARDTPQALKQYMEYFLAGAVGLTGEKREIDVVVNQYGARYEIEKTDSALGYHVNHTTDMYVIDREGKVRHRFKHEDKPEEIAAGVRRLIS
ncbi:MAG: SCO family protein [Blastocatellia bacterium]|nr:SCO family protein [Blastocatellia bacterium]